MINAWFDDKAIVFIVCCVQSKSLDDCEEKRVKVILAERPAENLSLVLVGDGVITFFDIISLGNSGGIVIVKWLKKLSNIH